MIKYAYTGDKTKLAAFLREARRVAVAPPRACASTPGETDAARGAFADKVRAAVREIGQTTGTLLTKSNKPGKSGYYLDFLVRKLHLASIAVAAGTCDPTCSLKRVRELSADAKEHLQELPEDWTAAEASAFVCGRPDWSALVSMSMCLWKEVADATEDLSLIHI